jgi:hypothetical protein
LCECVIRGMRRSEAKRNSCCSISRCRACSQSERAALAGDLARRIGGNLPPVGSEISGRMVSGLCPGPDFPDGLPSDIGLFLSRKQQIGSLIWINAAQQLARHCCAREGRNRLGASSSFERCEAHLPPQPSRPGFRHPRRVRAKYKKSWNSKPAFLSQLDSLFAKGGVQGSRSGRKRPPLPHIPGQKPV